MLGLASHCVLPRASLPISLSPLKIPLSRLNSSPSIHGRTLADPPRPSLLRRSSSDPTKPLSPSSLKDDLSDAPEAEEEPRSSGDDGAEAEVEKVEGKKNRRRIRCRIPVDADLETVWRVLTDYEGLASFIPSLSVSQLIDRGDGFARIYQVGQQNLGLGLKFKAKTVLDCFEGGLELVPLGRRRDIEFKMVEGDFQMFEGRWSIEQIDNETYKDSKFILGQEFQTTLSYFVELEPKLWLPVHLLEGRICGEVKLNLQSVREEAQRVQNMGSKAFSTLEIRGNDDNPTGLRC